VHVEARRVRGRVRLRARARVRGRGRGRVRPGVHVEACRPMRLCMCMRISGAPSCAPYYCRSITTTYP